MNLEDRLQAVEDMIQIDKLEKIYGYYLDNQMFQEVIDLFSDNTESVEVGDRGVFRGKDGVRRFFHDYLGRGGKPREPGDMAFHMQHQGVVDIEPGGKKAKGRWYCTMIQARSVEEGGPTRSVLGHGVYENEFVKEDGVWKFSKLFYGLHYRSPIAEGWAETPMIAAGLAPGSDAPPTAYHPYPDIAVVPFHWKHPVTGE
ncbi:nuclear transport factor 2 family protein [Chloroflexota bacterium]